jgi:hypothetical protein
MQRKKKSYGRKTVVINQIALVTLDLNVELQEGARFEVLIVVNVKLTVLSSVV